jgi:glycosyltransferase involved in cell wall biosynthesis
LLFLAIDPPRSSRVESDALAASLAGADLVVVENLCSLPLNLNASAATVAVLDRHPGRVLFHHHDLASERPALAGLVEFPPDRPNSLHVTINDAARRTLATRGISACTIRNAFDLDPQPGDRAGTRASRGFAATDLVVLQPTRAIPRKQVGRGVAFTHDLAALLPDRPPHYWLTGPAEEGYGLELDALLATSPVPVTRGWAPRAMDAYAAADVVVFPSNLEGFGNPVVEAMIAERPVATAHYPVLDELLGLGLQVFSVEDPASLARWLRTPDGALHARNWTCLRDHFALADLPHRIADALDTVGWTHW